jgi:hypothetical protein
VVLGVFAAVGGTLLIARVTTAASGDPTVVEVQVIPIQPRGAHWVVTAARNPQHDQMSYASISGLVPLHPPALHERPS